MFTDAAAQEYTALRTPVEIVPDSGNPTVRIPTVLSGWPDIEQRANPQIPFIAVRPTGCSAVTGDDGQRFRRAPMLVMIAVHCDAVADSEYALVIAERIWRGLAERPYLGEGQYTIDADSIEWSESDELLQIWPGYVLGMTVPVILPAFLQTEDPYGQAINWEGIYDEPGSGAGVGPGPDPVTPRPPEAPEP